MSLWDEVRGGYAVESKSVREQYVGSPTRSTRELRKGRMASAVLAVADAQAPGVGQLVRSCVTSDASIYISCWSSGLGNHEHLLGYGAELTALCFSDSKHLSNLRHCSDPRTQLVELPYGRDPVRRVGGRIKKNFEYLSQNALL